MASRRHSSTTMIVMWFLLCSIGIVVATPFWGNTTHNVTGFTSCGFRIPSTALWNATVVGNSSTMPVLMSAFYTRCRGPGDQPETDHVMKDFFFPLYTTIEDAEGESRLSTCNVLQQCRASACCFRQFLSTNACSLSKAVMKSIQISRRKKKRSPMHS